MLSTTRGGTRCRLLREVWTVRRGLAKSPVKSSVRPAKGWLKDLLPALQVLLELFPGHTVDDAFFLHPGSTCLRDAALGEAQGSLVVGVGVYRDLYTRVHGLPDVGDGEVEAVHVGVELQRRVRRLCLPDKA